jgi:putative tryptophan/tyrosine transport system substrate-binding protein
MSSKQKSANHSTLDSRQETEVWCTSTMTKNTLAHCVITLVLAFVLLAETQPPKKVPRKGFLSTGSEAAYAPSIEAFRQGLGDFGYVMGKNINIEYRYGKGRFERLPELAEELFRLKVDVLVVSSVAAGQAAKKLTATIPIVVANAGDPLGTRFVASLAQPGGNVTDLTHYSAELLGRRLELLKEVAPKVCRFAFLNGPDGTAARSMFKDTRGAAKALGVKFQLVEVNTQNPDIEGAFRVIGFGAGGTKSHPGDAPGARMCERRWSYVLRGEPC